MIERWYMIVGIGDLDEWLARADCVTQTARTSLDGSLAIVKLSAQADGSLTHAQALALVQTDAWQGDSEA
mgnify:CR=1 FL=1|tara:strand:+ start:283 stop:492 length:210 start_codon:yes stop_codon:yes gene_type:complete